MVEIGSRVGLSGLNVSQTEFLHEAIDCFSPPIVDKDLIDGNEVFTHPVAALNEHSPVEFVVRSNNRDHIDLTSAKLHGSFKLIKNNGEDIEEAADVSICNIFPLTLFKICDVYNSEAKKTTLATSMYHDDDDEGKDSFFSTTTSKALAHRNKWIKGSKEVHFVTGIHADIFRSFRLLPPNIEIKLKLLPNTTGWGILANAQDYKCKLLSLRLSIRKIQTSQEVLRAYEAKLEKEAAILPFNQTKIKTFVVASGTTQYHQQNISGVGARLPRQIIFAFVKTEALSGNSRANPFNFHHYDLSYFNLTVNGQNKPYQAFTPNWATGDYLREYTHLLNNIGIGSYNESIGLSHETFAKGKSIFAWDLAPDTCNGEHHHREEYGDITFEIKFRTALPDTIQILVYFGYSGGISINKEQQVILMPV